MSISGGLSNVVTKISSSPSTSMELKQLPLLQPGEDDVIIKVKSCGVNFPDLLQVQGKYQFKPPLPFAPGGEIAGIVSSVGSDVVNFKIGDKVTALTGYGGFSSYVRAKEYQILKMPSGLSFEQASAFTMTYGTTYYALKDRAQLKEGETLLILGASGGVGTAAIELGKLMGARVIACASTDKKLEICRQLGADEVINYTCTDRELKKKVKSFGGADVVYDAVGDRFSEPCLRSMNWGGRFLVIGFAAGDIPKIPINIALLKSVAIVGVFWGAWKVRESERANEQLNQIAQWIQEGKLNPLITKEYRLEDAAKCLEDFQNRKVTGKVVIICDSKNTSKM
jgi:NADPH:quinone reductase